jgi:flagellar assembly protein FliH
MNTFSSEQTANVQVFRYPQVEALIEDLDSCAGQDGADSGAREREARDEGFREGEKRAKREHEDAPKREREAIQKAVEEFQRDKAHYFQRVEAEVVQLALSIARKVLHRESQVDPLLLAGMVRFALQKFEAGTKAKLLVNRAEAANWREVLKQLVDSGAITAIEEDGSLPPQRCILQTDLGITELGIEPQLKEIENGLLDLLASRPQVAR